MFLKFLDNVFHSVDVNMELSNKNVWIGFWINFGESVLGDMTVHTIYNIRTNELFTDTNTNDEKYLTEKNNTQIEKHENIFDDDGNRFEYESMRIL